MRPADKAAITRHFRDIAKMAELAARDPDERWRRMACNAIGRELNGICERFAGPGAVMVRDVDRGNVRLGALPEPTVTQHVQGGPGHGA